MKNITKTVLSIAVAITLAFPLAVRADEGKETPLVIPNTVAEIHQAVDKEMSEMDKMIESGSIKDLHHHAFAVRDLIAALPDKSVSLSQDKLTAVKSSGKFVATLAERLDAAGDGNDKAAAAENFNKLTGVVDTVWANYPAAVPSVQK